MSRLGKMLKRKIFYKGGDIVFPCNRCGACCKMVGNSVIGSSMALANGVCKWFDDITNLCTIYGNRPMFCNVDACYEQFYSWIMTREEFYEMNLQVCNNLKLSANLREH